MTVYFIQPPVEKPPLTIKPAADNRSRDLIYRIKLISSQARLSGNLTIVFQIFSLLL